MWQPLSRKFLVFVYVHAQTFYFQLYVHPVTFYFVGSGIYRAPEMPLQGVAVGSQVLLARGTTGEEEENRCPRSSCVVQVWRRSSVRPSSFGGWNWLLVRPYGRL